MSTLYDRATALYTGLHLSPTSGSGAYRANSAVGDYFATHRCKHTVYRVTGATETVLGTNVGVTNWGYTANGFDNLSGTWTPASTAVANGGACLRIDTTVESDEPSSNTVTTYSGPLFCTNIDAQQWTFYRRMENSVLTDGCYVIFDHANTYISGIALSGTPTASRLHPANDSTSHMVPFDNIVPSNYQGNWDNISSNHLHFGQKRGTVGNSSFASPTPDRQYLRRTFVSLPAVQAVTLNKVEGVLGWRSTDASYDGFPHVHAWVTQGDGYTPRGTIATDWQDSVEMGIGTSTCGRAVDPAAGAGVSVQAGDRLVVEVGWYVGPSGGYLSAYHYYGGTSTDLTDGGIYGNCTVYTGWLEFTNAASGTTYYQTVSDAASVGVSLSRQAKKSLSVAASVVMSLNRRVRRVFGVVTSARGAPSRQVRKRLATLVASTSALNRSTSRVLWAISVADPSLLSAIRTRVVQAVAAAAVVSTVVRSTGKRLASLTGAVPSVLSSFVGGTLVFYKTVVGVAGVVPTVVRSAGKSFVSLATAVPAARRSTGKSLASLAAAVPTVVRFARKSLISLAAALPSVGRVAFLRRSLTTAATTSPAVSRVASLHRSVSNSAAVVVAMSRVATFYRSLSGAASVLPSAIASLADAVFYHLRFHKASAAVPSVSRVATLRRTLSTVSASVPGLARGALLHLSYSAIASALPSVVRVTKLVRSVSSSVSGVASLVRTLVLGVSAVANVSVLRGVRKALVRSSSVSVSMSRLGTFRRTLSVVGRGYVAMRLKDSIRHWIQDPKKTPRVCPRCHTVQNDRYAVRCRVCRFQLGHFRG